MVASYSWDRFLLDPQPGPRSPADFSGLRQVSERNWEVTADSTLRSGGRSTLPMLARHTEARVVLLDPSAGAAGLRAQLAELARAVNAASITLVDVGGDIAAHGDEPELMSPLADSMTLAALDGMDLPAQVAIAGPGLDGELSADSVRERCAGLDGRITELRAVHVRPYLAVLDRHPSEATTLLAAAALGVRGLAEIRDQAALVEVDDQSATIYVVQSSELLSANKIARELTAVRSLAEAEQVTVAISGRSELTHERRKALAGASRPEPAERAELASRYASYRLKASNRGVSLLTFRRLTEVIGLHEYEPTLIRAIVGANAHPQLAICQLA